MNTVVESIDALFGDDNNSFVRGVGEEFRTRGYRVRHPVILIPGFVTSGMLFSFFLFVFLGCLF